MPALVDMMGKAWDRWNAPPAPIPPAPIRTVNPGVTGAIPPPPPPPELPDPRERRGNSKNRDMVLLIGLIRATLEGDCTPEGIKATVNGHFEVFAPKFSQFTRDAIAEFLVDRIVLDRQEPAA